VKNILCTVVSVSGNDLEETPKPVSMTTESYEKGPSSLRTRIPLSGSEDYFYPDNLFSSPERYERSLPDNSFPYISSEVPPRRVRMVLEDHQYGRPEPSPAEQVQHSSPSNYLGQILTQPLSVRREQKSRPVCEIHYAPEPYEYPRVGNVYNENEEEYNIPVLPNRGAPIYGYAAPIRVPELAFPNRRLRFEYAPRPEVFEPQDLYSPHRVYVGSDQEAEYVP
jgi:hypothetical protein